MPSSLPQLHEGRCVTEKLLTSGSERRARLVAHEQGPTELLLEHFDARADGRLPNVKTLGSSEEAAGRHDL
jgi:hypothetical protein